MWRIWWSSGWLSPVDSAELGALARRALEQEVLLTPKPGLVDRRNSGAHRDMTAETFLRSAAALEPHFVLLARAGEAQAELPPAETLPPLRRLGMQAEEEMLRATGGVNTHKGALFSIGLLCACAGRQTARRQPLSPETLCALAAETAAGISARELGGSGTNGLRVHASTGARGVRGEAESGFASVRQYALPYLRAGCSQRDQLLALLALMRRVEDTNVLHRAGPEGLRWLQQRAGETLERFSLAALEQLDEECIRRNISPGGCADLLAIGLFLVQLDRA